MARVNSLGVNDPVAVFERFRPVRRELCALQRRCFPFKADYNALAAAIAGLDAAAIHFTKDPHFYAPHHVQPNYSVRPSDEEYPRD
jgi:hypothetical protein